MTATVDPPNGAVRQYGEDENNLAEAPVTVDPLTGTVRQYGVDEAPTKGRKKKAVTPALEPAPVVVVEVPALTLQRATISVIGDTDLICHKWSEKAKQMMRDKQMQKATRGREAKNPDQDVADSLYDMPGGGYGFPSIAFKKAAVGACRFVNMKMTEARGVFRVIGDPATNGEFVRITTPSGGIPKPVKREDMVRVGMGTADIRYRGSFPRWRAEFNVVFNPRVISLQQLLNLFQHAGFSIGIGEWRPERDGQYGTFHVEGLPIEGLGE